MAHILHGAFQAVVTAESATRLDVLCIPGNPLLCSTFGRLRCPASPARDPLPTEYQDGRALTVFVAYEPALRLRGNITPQEDRPAYDVWAETHRWSPQRRSDTPPASGRSGGIGSCWIQMSRTRGAACSCQVRPARVAHGKGRLHNENQFRGRTLAACLVRVWRRVTAESQGAPSPSARLKGHWHTPPPQPYVEWADRDDYPLEHLAVMHQQGPSIGPRPCACVARQHPPTSHSATVPTPSSPPPLEPSLNSPEAC